MFLTDGITSDRDQCLDKIDKLGAKLKTLNKYYGTKCSVYCLGYTEGHDAELLHKLAQMGTEHGNFIYIDGKDDDDDRMSQALSESIGLARDEAQGDHLLIHYNADEAFERQQFEVPLLKSSLREELLIQNHEENDLSVRILEIRTVFEGSVKIPID